MSKNEWISSNRGFPKGFDLKSVYDRSNLILRAVDNLKRTLIEESIIVALVCMVFLLHFRSALCREFLYYLSRMLISFIIMERQGINANIMSLGAALPLLSAPWWTQPS